MRLAILTATILLSAAPALADGHRVQPVTDPLVLKECGACHMAFPPAFLPAQSWNRIVDGLADHFGDDASLPPDKAAAVRTYLAANAGTARNYARWVAPGGAPLRITDNPAFLHKHRFPERVWKDPKVVTKSNCPACHDAAEKGDFDDD
jgi:hypothetical protein